MRLAPLVAAASIAFSVPAALGDNPTLLGTVGPGFTITLRHPDGTTVTHLDPGTYTLVVDDRSPGHNFHLTGPGVDQATGVETEGQETWTLNVTSGFYIYVCDIHVGILEGEFAVGSAVMPPAPTTRTQTTTATTIKNAPKPKPKLKSKKR